MLKRLLLLLLCATPLAAQTINPNEIKPSASNNQWLHTVTGGVPPIWDTLPSSQLGITPHVVPPISGQYAVIYPTHADILSEECGVACGYAHMSNTSGNFFWQCLGFSCNLAAHTSGKWYGFTYPSYVDPANVSAIYAVAVTSGQAIANGAPAPMPSGGSNTTSLNCTGAPGQPNTLFATSSPPSVPWLSGQQSRLLSVAPADLPTIECDVDLGDSTAYGGENINVSYIALYVYYTGTPSPVDGRIQIVSPLIYNEALNQLLFDPNGQGYLQAAIVSSLPGAAAASGQIWQVTDGVNSTDCTTGGGSTVNLCRSNGTTWSIFSAGGGGGVTSINGTAGAYTFTGSGVGCSGTTCTFSTSPLTGSGTLGYLPLWTPNSTTLGNSNIDDGITTAATLTAHEPIAVTGSTHGITIPAGTAVAGAAGKVVYASDSTNGYAEVNENATGLSRVCTAANGICGAGSSPLTTKGDLYGFDTANARIPVGSDGQVLTADSTQALGLKWADRPAQVSTTFVGVPANSQVMLYAPSTVALTIPSSCTGSYGKAAVAATGSAAFTVTDVTTSTTLCTATWSASGTSAVFSGTGGSVSAGDVIEISGPASADATLATIGISVYASR